MENIENIQSESFLCSCVLNTTLGILCISRWCLCNFWDLEKVFSFSFDSPTVYFSFWSLPRFPLLWPPQTMNVKVKICCNFCLIFFFFLLLVPASLSGMFALSAWNSSGHREAAGLSFVSRNHSYWFGVWSNYGGFVLGRGKAGCMDGSPVCGCQGRAMLWGVCALWPLHSWLSLLEKALLWNTDLLRTWCSFECRWMTLLAGASRARGKCWFS